MSFGYAGLTFLVGLIFAGLELVTGKYPRSWAFVFRSRAFWGYCLIYGLVAAGGFLGLDWLVAEKKIQIEGIVLASPLLRALIVGVSAKSLLHINLFNVTVNSQPFPVGLETITQFFEPHLLRSIVFDEFNGVRAFVTPYSTRFKDLEQVRRSILDNIPTTLPSQEVGAFRDDLTNAASVVEALEKGFRFLGTSTFLRIFQ
jgi:hypothetical protein